MSYEITVNGSLCYADSEGDEESLVPEQFLLTIGTKKYVKLKQNIGTSEEAIKLGEVTSLGYACFVNRDPTNYIELRVGTGGSKFATLKPNGGFAIVYLGSDAQVPYAIANTAACQMALFICSQ